MALRVRSGNRPADTGHTDNMAATLQQPEQWKRTRAALRELEGRLRCSVCSSVLKQPICLGGCEHVFCGTCVDDRVGNECPVCHTPAWVKDVQINRQLDNIIQLCSKLNTLLGKDKQGENKMDLCQEDSLKVNTAEGECKKKIKMWFSPRRGKARFVMEREDSQQVPSHNKPAHVVEAYEFVSSSPVSEQVKKKRNPRARKSKKKNLEDINQEWGVGVHNQNNINLERSVSKAEKSVSFGESSIAIVGCDDEFETNKECALSSKDGENENEGCVEDLVKAEKAESLVINQASELNCSMSSKDLDGTIPCKEKNAPGKADENQAEPSRCTRARQSITVSPKRERPSKRKDHAAVSPAPKRPRKGQVKVTNGVKTENEPQACVGSGEDCPKPELPETPPKHSTTPSRSRDGRRTSQTGLSNTTSPGNLPVTKKNIRGETLLHVASIKGDLKGVEELLKNGANPNVKDNAGWTPLHEACNHGHSAVVELLLRHEALVNTTGYQNDSPLHDAAKNGHATIVHLLLSHGASPDAVNIFGLRPVDYAETEEIRLALLQAQTHKEPQVKQPCATLNKGQRREGAVVLLASGLSDSQKKDVTKLAALLKAEICSGHNGSVTHVIVGDDPMLRTMKCMMGILGGCWVLQSAWVKACLASHAREPEEAYEVPGGPSRARLNREQLLPGLLDGCHFYFLGCFKEHKKEDLTELVKAAGGQILLRQPKPDSDVTQTINTVAYHANADSDQRFCTQYIIYDKASKYIPGRVRQGKVWFAPSSWLIDSITCFQLLPVQQE